jgi:hypothetical protein
MTVCLRVFLQGMKRIKVTAFEEHLLKDVL